jgi:putative DNA primase/helicase
MNFDGVPAELRLRDQWVCWRYEMRGGKRTKVPYDPKNGRRAMSTVSRTWGSFDRAIRARPYEGIGFVFSDHDPYAGVDLDDCYDPDGCLNAAASRIVESFASYTEVTPSGRGVHVIVRGVWTARRHRTKQTGWGGDIEVYDRARYFTMTGGLGEIRYAQPLLDMFGRRMSPPKVPVPIRPVGLQSLLPDDRDVLERLRGNPRSRALYAGDTSAYDADRSAADMALVCDLAYWCGPDPQRIDRLFRASGLMRFKWNAPRGETTYGWQTIERALDRTHDFYGTMAITVGNPFALATAAKVPSLNVGRQGGMT